MKFSLSYSCIISHFQRTRFLICHHSVQSSLLLNRYCGSETIDKTNSNYHPKVNEEEYNHWIEKRLAEIERLGKIRQPDFERLKLNLDEIEQVYMARKYLGRRYVLPRSEALCKQLMKVDLKKSYTLKSICTAAANKGYLGRTLNGFPIDPKRYPVREGFDRKVWLKSRPWITYIKYHKKTRKSSIKGRFIYDPTGDPEVSSNIGIGHGSYTNRLLKSMAKLQTEANESGERGEEEKTDVVEGYENAEKRD